MWMVVRDGVEVSGVDSGSLAGGPPVVVVMVMLMVLRMVLWMVVSYGW